MSSLAQPRDREKHRLLQAAKARAEADRANSVGEKEARLTAKLRRKKQIDFADYIDRDVPPITTGGHFAKAKPSAGLREFGTKLTHKSGLFDDLLKEAPGGGQFRSADADRYSGLEALEGEGRDRRKAAAGDYLPAYLQAARETQALRASGPGNEARVRAFRKAMNDNVVQTLGLQNHIHFAEPQYLNLRDLRGLEYRAARQIQALARCFFTRKWYLNYVVRKRLGVPFSGLEFAQNPFLRQFNKPNTHLNRLHQADGSKLTTAIPSASDLKLSTVQIKRLRNRQQESLLRIKGNTRMPDDTDGSRLIARSLRKGLSPSKIILDL